MIKNIQTLIAVCVLSAASASATSVTIGEPNTSVCYPFSCNDGASTGLSIHYQQVFASGLFPTAAISIHNISFGIDGFTGLITGQGGTVLNGNYQIAFSTTKAAVGGLTANLNDNQGLDQTVFYNNSTISGFTAASGSPLTIGGSSFIYNPLAGNLLMDIIVTNQAFLSSADAGSFDGSASYDSNGLFLPFNTSSVFMIGNQSVVTGAFGLVTTFDFSTVNAAVTTPEIGSMLMVGFGVAILLYAKRRSSDFAKLTPAAVSMIGFIAFLQSSGQAQESVTVHSVVVPPHSFGDQKKRPVVSSKSPLAVAAPKLASTPASLPVWSANFADAGSSYTVWFAGNSPSSNTTTNIETNIVPVRIVLCNDGSNPCTPGSIAYIYDPAKPLRNNRAGVTLSAAAATLSSPVFQNATYITGAGTTVGASTQYSDAMMRASFWNYPGNAASANPNWHTRLQYSLKPPITITVPTGQWDPTSAVDFGKISLFQLFQPLDAESSKYSPGQFTFFLLYNIAMSYGAAGPCCVLGYHTSDGANPAPSRTYGVAAYFDSSSKVPGGYMDVGAISHEIAEWIHNPFLSNTVPNWAGSGGCYNNMEVADPLEDRVDVAFKMSTFGRSYNMVNIALAPWFMKGSFGVEGYYTYKGAVDPKFSTAATCP